MTTHYPQEGPRFNAMKLDIRQQLSIRKLHVEFVNNMPHARLSVLYKEATGILIQTGLWEGQRGHWSPGIE